MISKDRIDDKNTISLFWVIDNSFIVHGYRGFIVMRTSLPMILMV